MTGKVCDNWIWTNECSFKNKCRYNHPRFCWVGFEFEQQGPQLVQSGPQLVHSGPQLVHSGPQLVQSSPQLVQSGPQLVQSEYKFGPFSIILNKDTFKFKVNIMPQMC